jgi:hypothetical protein
MDITPNYGPNSYTPSPTEDILNYQPNGDSPSILDENGNLLTAGKKTTLPTNSLDLSPSMTEEFTKLFEEPPTLPTRVEIPATPVINNNNDLPPPIITDNNVPPIITDNNVPPPVINNNNALVPVINNNNSPPVIDQIMDDPLPPVVPRKRLRSKPKVIVESDEEEGNPFINNEAEEATPSEEEEEEDAISSEEEEGEDIESEGDKPSKKKRKAVSMSDNLDRAGKEEEKARKSFNRIQERVRIDRNKAKRMAIADQKKVEKERNRQIAKDYKERKKREEKERRKARERSNRSYLGKCEFLASTGPNAGEYCSEDEERGKKMCHRHLMQTLKKAKDKKAKYLLQQFEKLPPDIREEANVIEKKIAPYDKRPFKYHDSR